MTIAQMHLAWRMQLDKSGSLELPSFLPEEIDFWLNAAANKFAKIRYTGSDKGLGFEENLKRTEDLKTLIIDDDLIPVAGTLRPNSWVCDASALDRKWFILGEEVDIHYTKLGEVNHSTKRQGVTQCTIDTYRSHIDDPYSEHILHYEEAKPLRLVYQDYIELVTDGNYTITKYYIRFLRKPAEMSLVGSDNCDLPEHTHDEIVLMAVSMALENIEQPRYQSQMNELNKIE
jgi:hypothetical protein